MSLAVADRWSTHELHVQGLLQKYCVLASLTYANENIRHESHVLHTTQAESDALLAGVLPGIA